ncbi:alkanesulfonate monooxygenase SsuD/methylene tetrahydromethanopterin reductase-like flavin-dependent oxidoreductase (luciferase family) [Kribbella aluminosa]|uniref:Alkanesulfonate monooxygenase SsuD/methylene tetrahydromethanopterin reductase-like flavin-dependent oxidoreductase (Luciferase family) n=1 Tax=Kribbella aluminosa TaxID=416017 RepID=A0ABS4UQF1_9ACTN|nr:LLM class flavin-dependent oxidoreductase [Kribbella aluminosa]MBP2353852.1 alkanesulfonate monooxygenase SsuD/methylene tetrahydromethanopterin reductase-like flavin-dependent oxidoreductase (luciferase family) [Kribbella aluminosa]
MSLEFGVILPTSTPDPERPILGDVKESARYAEEVGLDSIWSTDHLVASAPLLESSVVLATAAAVTERITIGYNVMLLALRPVAWAAKQISTLQYVSNNRVVLGVGTGNPAHGAAGWQAAGVEYADRGRLTDDALAVLPDLIAGTHPDIKISPSAKVPPIFVAGSGVRAQRRAAKYADGWATIALPPEEVRANLARINELADGKQLKATVVAPQLTGDPLEQLAAYEAAGTERIILPPTGDWRHDYDHAAELRARYHQA